jgi:glutaconate CoA-transferase, subunit B
MTSCTLGEMMIGALARTIEDGTLVFHGYGSPLAQLAMHVAKRTHAPRMVLVAGATCGIDPEPPFLAPTTNDWVMDRGASSSVVIDELFDLAAAGRMGRMFLSGLQIDQWGNCNVTAIGYPDIKLKLPGGGGGCNLSCDVAHITLWTTAHRSPKDSRGKRRYRVVKDCDFITNLGHRTRDGRLRRNLGHRGNGPQWLVTELGLFDFDSDGQMRLRSLYPDTSVDDVLENTEFKPALAAKIETIPVPEHKVVALIRRLDPLKIHEKEIRAEDMERRFEIVSG